MGEVEIKDAKVLEEMMIGKGVFQNVTTWDVQTPALKKMILGEGVMNEIEEWTISMMMMMMINDDDDQ